MASARAVSAVRCACDRAVWPRLSLSLAVFAAEGSTVVFCARNRDQGEKLQADVNALGASKGCGRGRWWLTRAGGRARPDPVCAVRRE